MLIVLKKAQALEGARPQQDRVKVDQQPCSTQGPEAASHRISS